MYGVMLAAFLGTGSAAPGWDSHETMRDLRRAIEELRKDQTEQRVESLERTVAFLRHRLLEQQLEEIRRDLDWLRQGGVVGPVPLPDPLSYPSVAPAGRAVIRLQAPAGAALTVNDRAIPLTSPNPAFVTPVLGPGREYHYDFAVTADVGGKMVTRARRVPVRPGEVIRLTYEEMPPRVAPPPP